MHRFMEVKMCGQRRQVVGIMIHVMAIAGLGGTSMPAPVVGYDAIAVAKEEHHLRVPIIGGQRPAVAEDDGLTFAPVLVVDRCAIFDSNRRHIVSFLFVTVQLSEKAIESRRLVGTMGCDYNPDFRI